MPARTVLEATAAVPGARGAMRVQPMSTSAQLMGKRFAATTPAVDVAVVVLIPPRPIGVTRFEPGQPGKFAISGLVGWPRKRSRGTGDHGPRPRGSTLELHGPASD